MKLFACLLVLIMFFVPRTEAAEVKIIAESNYQWTGIAISREDRMFVCFPTWRNYPSYKVAEIKNGKEVPYPNATTAASFSCVQSVYVDKDNYLWILDTGKPRGQKAEAGSAKLYKIDLKQNKVIWQYDFPANVDLATSYLNDVRVDTRRNYAYLTDSSQGGIVVVNLSTAMPTAVRALDNIPQVKADLPGIDFVTTGFDNHQTNSDGLALSEDGRKLYFAAMTGKKLYEISTAKLRRATALNKAKGQDIKVINANSVPSDGFWLIKNKLYMGDLAKEGLYTFDLQSKQGTSIKLQQAIHWADSFAQDSQGRLYFTTSQINYRDKIKEPYKIYQLR